MTISFDDIENAFYFVSSDQPFMNSAYLCKKTGNIYYDLLDRLGLLDKWYNYEDMTEIYVSTDIETDGPAPGLNSMISFASACGEHERKYARKCL
jgi:hypothetical protein